MDVIKLLEEKAKKLSGKPAIIFREQPITFQQLKDNVFKLADGLKKQGIKKGDKIAIYLPS